MPQNTFDDKVNIGSSNGLLPSGRCWPSFTTTYGAMRDQWVNPYISYRKASENGACRAGAEILKWMNERTQHFGLQTLHWSRKPFSDALLPQNCIRHAHVAHVSEEMSDVEWLISKGNYDNTIAIFAKMFAMSKKILAYTCISRNSLTAWCLCAFFSILPKFNVPF